MNYEQRIVELVESDEFRMRALCAVRTLDLPDWLIAAGFVRNLVWENIFNQKDDARDIDVIYFCRSDISPERDGALEKRLQQLEPGFPWSVKNQARMHLKYGDAPYQSTLDAMRFWPEKQTSIGVMPNNIDAVVVRHCFDLSLQFSGNVDHNSARSIETFKKRISDMPQMNWVCVLGYSAAVVSLFVLGAIKTNIRNSGFVTGCLVLGYLNDFVLLRSIISVSRGQKIDARILVTTTLLILGNAAVIYLSYGWVLALTTIGAVIVDGLVLKFR